LAELASGGFQAGGQAEDVDDGDVGGIPVAQEAKTTPTPSSPNTSITTTGIDPTGRFHNDRQKPVSAWLHHHRTPSHALSGAIESADSSTNTSRSHDMTGSSYFRHCCMVFSRETMIGQTRISRPSSSKTFRRPKGRSSVTGTKTTPPVLM
jgi:hypothetical protein